MKHLKTLLAGVLVALLAVGLWRADPPERDAAPGYAGLGSAAAGYAQARPGDRLAFPDDHGAHPDYRIEWWYLTANLEDAAGRPFGIQWTLFRQALAPPGTTDGAPDSAWTSRQLWMAHAAVSTPDGHRAAERFARGMNLADAEGQAGVSAAPFAAWLDDWRLAAPDDAGTGLDNLTVRAAGGDFAYRLTLAAQGPLVVHGDHGFSRKSADGQGSIYYSQPFYRIDGTLTVEGEEHAVSGRAWLDREWSSQLLGPGQSGWDWFSLHLADGARLMAFRLRGAGQAGGDYLSGSWIAADGAVTPLDGDALHLTPLARSPVAGRELPTAWRVQVPAHELDVHVTAVHPDQWMATTFAYWEGMVRVTDTRDGSPYGVGYLEMTGY
ncbi:lipocalin-like domain-containing protein [Modicisalibacter sp. 'Wilcox']|uniref:lipocalin-like domain-containing protein n=1 Tax=Modicisalibacter sp. 'Wilcox' TaxID=2679914 RepID=UPI0013D06B07|nr:lipocalin-like domain-containing protein [Modicisalibacter sp. 'Wilcox']